MSKKKNPFGLHVVKPVDESLSIVARLMPKRQQQALAELFDDELDGESLIFEELFKRMVHYTREVGDVIYTSSDFEKPYFQHDGKICYFKEELTKEEIQELLWLIDTVPALGYVRFQALDPLLVTPSLADQLSQIDLDALIGDEQLTALQIAEKRFGLTVPQFLYWCSLDIRSELWPQKVRGAALEQLISMRYIRFKPVSLNSLRTAQIEAAFNAMGKEFPQEIRERFC